MVQAALGPGAVANDDIAGCTTSAPEGLQLEGCHGPLSTIVCGAVRKPQGV